MALNVAISTRRRQSRASTTGRLFELAWAQPSASTFPLTLRGRPRQPAREVMLQVSFRSVLALVALGSHLGRKGDGSPGWQTRWLGRRSLRLLVEGVTMAA